MPAKPIRIFYGRLTDKFYATQHWTETIENGTRHFKCTGKKYDVTQDIANIIVSEGIEFVEATEPPAPATVGTNERTEE